MWKTSDGPKISTAFGSTALTRWSVGRAPLRASCQSLRILSLGRRETFSADLAVATSLAEVRTEQEPPCILPSLLLLNRHLTCRHRGYLENPLVPQPCLMPSAHCHRKAGLASTALARFIDIFRITWKFVLGDFERSDQKESNRAAPSPVPNHLVLDNYSQMAGTRYTEMHQSPVLSTVRRTAKPT